MSDYAKIIPFRRHSPAPKPSRPKAKIVSHPALDYRPLARNLDAKATAARLHAMLQGGDKAGAAQHWRAHVAQIEAGAKAAFSQAQIERMVDAYRSAVRAAIDALKAGQ